MTRELAAISVTSGGLTAQDWAFDDLTQRHQRRLWSFARTWTSELKNRKIRTNELSPGPVDTPMLDEQFPSKEGAAEARKQITAVTSLAPGASRSDRFRSPVLASGLKQLRRRNRPTGQRWPDSCLDRTVVEKRSTKSWPGASAA
jgi:NAD(P)-dependent dehydrogenase (short-subunit alcohol dehydrogenase family)